MRPICEEIVAMTIRKATPADLAEILSIYADARAFMVRTDNPRQWAARNWPPESLIRQDIAREKCYVCQDEREILAVFYYDYGEDIDATYRKIENGNWLNDGPYGVVHRIAARCGSGAGRYCIQWAFEQCGHLRIDTHGDNTVMQKVLRKLGFICCGIIHVAEDHDPRLAYEKTKE